MKLFNRFNDWCCTDACMNTLIVVAAIYSGIAIFVAVAK